MTQVDWLYMSKQCSSIYFRCKTTVLAFTLSVTVMLLTDLTSAPDDKSNIAKKWEKVSPIPISILHTKTITDTCANTQKVLTIQQYQYIDINNPSLQ